MAKITRQFNLIESGWNNDFFSLELQTLNGLYLCLALRFRLGS